MKYCFVFFIVSIFLLTHLVVYSQAFNISLIPYAVPVATPAEAEVLNDEAIAMCLAENENALSISRADCRLRRLASWT